jgi:hypothetical protein
LKFIATGNLHLQSVALRKLFRSLAVVLMLGAVTVLSAGERPSARPLVLDSRRAEGQSGRRRVDVDAVGLELSVIRGDSGEDFTTEQGRKIS